MALSQLRPMVIEGDRPAPQGGAGFTKLPDGSLIMRGQRPVEAKPGVLAGFRRFIEEKLGPKPVPQDQWWIPQAQPAAPVAPVAAPVAAGVPGAPLPAYNAWSEIEEMAAKEKRIADELGGVSRAVMNSPAIIEGKWLGGK